MARTPYRKRQSGAQNPAGVGGYGSRSHCGLSAQFQERKPVEGRKYHSLSSIVPHGATLAGFEKAHTES
jgi:hypothetical protein